MPLTDLLGKTTRTASGAEVAAPTVRCFFRALEVFGLEIGVVRQAARQIEGPISVDVAVAPFLLNPGDGRLEYVLGELWRASTAFRAEEAARAVAAVVAPLAARIEAILGDPEAGGAIDDDVDPGVLLVFGVAERWRCLPTEVMGEPLGVFLDAVTAYSRPQKQADDDGMAFVGGMTEQQAHVPLPANHVAGLA